MLPASVKGPGMNMGFPDVCLTPAFPSPIPIPYPNMGMHAMAAPFCPTILNSMMPALNMGSIIPMTLGDQPGVANPLFMQMGMFTMGCPTVLLQGMPAINLTSPTTGNNMNNPVGAVLVPGAPTILYGCAGPDPGQGRRDGPRAVVSAMDPDGVGRVAIRFFSASVAAAVHTEVARLRRDGLALVVFDLRDNPGGELLAAIEVLRDLLPEGAVVAAIEDGDGDTITYRARGDACALPIVVQVNGGTASAAELFAGCLKAHGRALVAGEATYGKGTARALLGGVMVDVARFRLPGGAEVPAAGIQPDTGDLARAVAAARRP